VDIRQLTYVLSVAESGSFLKASENLHVSQPALTLSIKKLETELGFSLFRRTPHGVYLTEMGVIFCQQIQPVKITWDVLMQQLRGDCDRSRRHLRIGVGARVFSSGVFEDLVRFLDIHTDINATFITEAGRDFFPDLANGHIDIILDRLPLQGGISFAKKLAVYDLICERQCVLMSIVDPRHKWKCITFNDIQEDALITSLEHSMEDRIIKDICVAHKIVPKRIYRSDNIYTIMDFVKKGKGVTVGPESFGEYYGVAAIPLEPEEMTYMKFIYLKRNDCDQDISLLRKYLNQRCNRRK